MFRTQPDSVTFNRDNWSTTQTVQIQAASDTNDRPERTSTITHIPTGEGFNNAEADSVTVNVPKTIPPPAAITASPKILVVTEGNETTYMLRLTAQTPTDVVVSVNVPENSYLTASPTQVTFTRARWQTPHNITVRAQTDDSDPPRSKATITHTAATGPASTIPADSVSIMVIKPIPTKTPPEIPPETPPSDDTDVTIPEVPTPSPVPPPPAQEPPPAASIQTFPQTEAPIIEGQTFGVTIRLSTPAADGLTKIAVQVLTEGDFGYRPSNTILYARIPAGGNATTIHVTSEDDLVDEPHGMVTFKLLQDSRTPAQYTLGPSYTAEVKVHDNDVAISFQQFTGLGKAPQPTPTPTPRAIAVGPFLGPVTTPTPEPPTPVPTKTPRPTDVPGPTPTPTPTWDWSPPTITVPGTGSGDRPIVPWIPGTGSNPLLLLLLILFALALAFFAYCVYRRRRRKRAIETRLEPPVD